jgi:hypothetical protein
VNVCKLIEEFVDAFIVNRLRDLLGINFQIQYLNNAKKREYDEVFLQNCLRNDSKSKYITFAGMSPPNHRRTHSLPVFCPLEGEKNLEKMLIFPPFGEGRASMNNPVGCFSEEPDCRAGEKGVS